MTGLPRPARRDPRLRGGRPRADAAPGGRDDAGAGGVAGAARSPRGCTSPSPATTTRRCGTRRRRSAVRRQQLRGLPGRGCPPERYAPFSGAEWTSLPYEGATACLRWPGPLRPEPPVAARRAVPGRARRWCSTATSTTSPRLRGRRSSPRGSRARRSWRPRTRSTCRRSATATECAAPLVRRFVRRLSAGDTSCASRVAEVRVVETFPRRAAAAVPAATRGRATAARSGRAAPPRWRRPRWPTRSSAGRSTTAARAAACAAGAGPGAAIDFVRFRFRKARFARDVPVSGRATWSLDSGAVRADLRLPGRGRPCAPAGACTGSWPSARLTGRLDGRAAARDDARARTPSGAARRGPCGRRRAPAAPPRGAAPRSGPCSRPWASRVAAVRARTSAGSYGRRRAPASGAGREATWRGATWRASRSAGPGATTPCSLTHVSSAPSVRATRSPFGAVARPDAHDRRRGRGRSRVAGRAGPSRDERDRLGLAAPPRRRRAPARAPARAGSGRRAARARSTAGA